MRTTLDADLPFVVAKLPPMLRFLIVLLMMLLPLQSVWSAAATVCTHEQGGAKPHFGHHAAHHAEPAEEQAPDENLASTAEGDHHHILGVHPLPSMPALPPSLVATQQDQPDRADPYPAALIAALERPPKAAADVLR